MSINYDNLWELLKERDMLKKDLCATAMIESSVLSRGKAIRILFLLESK